MFYADLTKAEIRALHDLRKPVFFTFHAPSHKRLVDLGLVREISPLADGSKRVAITKSGRDYCINHLRHAKAHA